MISRLVNAVSVTVIVVGSAVTVDGVVAAAPMQEHADVRRDFSTDAVLVKLRRQLKGGLLLVQFPRFFLRFGTWVVVMPLAEGKSVTVITSVDVTVGVTVNVTAPSQVMEWEQNTLAADEELEKHSRTSSSTHLLTGRDEQVLCSFNLGHNVLAKI